DKYEAKTGFDHVKQKIAALCLSRGAAARVDDIAFMTDYDAVCRHLRATHQMLTIETGDTHLPIVAVNDIAPALSRLRVPERFYRPTSWWASGARCSVLPTWPRSLPRAVRRTGHRSTPIWISRRVR
ncbi:MAG: hypothetical protein K2K86_07740, partial [Muribaculaceae bacterium]|nr:hypothetical protein [Muribaculaceae bacterium]